LVNLAAPALFLTARNRESERPTIPVAVQGETGRRKQDKETGNRKQKTKKPPVGVPAAFSYFCPRQYGEVVGKYRQQE
jgi:hypothetical protein